MKKLLLLAALTGGALASYGQGTIVFNNNASTTFNVTTNNATGTAAGPTINQAGNYRVGLYAAPTTGATSNSLSLVGLATNSTIIGKFNGGSGFVLPGGYAIGSQLTFQIRAWSFSAGLSYEEALGASAVNPLEVAYGASAIGTTTGGGTVPGNPPISAGALFGTNPGQVLGFEIKPVPEPSSIALGLLGLGAIALFRRKK